MRFNRKQKKSLQRCKTLVTDGMHLIGHLALYNFQQDQNFTSFKPLVNFKSWTELSTQNFPNQNENVNWNRREKNRTASFLAGPRTSLKTFSFVSLTYAIGSERLCVLVRVDTPIKSYGNFCFPQWRQKNEIFSSEAMERDIERRISYRHK